VTAHAGDRISTGVEAQEEEGDPDSLIELLEVELALETEVPVAPLGFVEIELP
jgi:hypothetical protein